MLDTDEREGSSRGRLGPSHDIVFKFLCSRIAYAVHVEV